MNSESRCDAQDPQVALRFDGCSRDFETSLFLSQIDLADFAQDDRRRDAPQSSIFHRLEHPCRAGNLVFGSSGRFGNEHGEKYIRVKTSQGPRTSFAHLPSLPQIRYAVDGSLRATSGCRPTVARRSKSTREPANFYCLCLLLGLNRKTESKEHGTKRQATKTFALLLPIACCLLPLVT
jgi:hypothetical protein